MMLFRAKVPSLASFAVDLSLQGEVHKGMNLAQPRFSPRTAGRPAGRGEGAFNQNSCAIWNDISRALEGKKN